MFAPIKLKRTSPQVQRALEEALAANKEALAANNHLLEQLLTRQQNQASETSPATKCEKSQHGQGIISTTNKSSPARAFENEQSAELHEALDDCSKTSSQLNFTKHWQRNTGNSRRAWMVKNRLTTSLVDWYCLEVDCTRRVIITQKIPGMEMIPVISEQHMLTAAAVHCRQVHVDDLSHIIQDCKSNLVTLKFSEQNPVQVEFLDTNECSDFLRQLKLLLPHLNHMSIEVLYTSRGALHKEVISFQHNTLQKAPHRSSRQHADFLARPKSLSTKSENGFTSGTLHGPEVPAQGRRTLGVSLPRNEIVRVDLAVRPDIAVVRKQPAGKASHGQRYANDIKDRPYRAGLLELPATAPAISSQKMWTTDEVSRLASLPRSASLDLH
jgi:hypothetical protein